MRISVMTAVFQLEGCHSLKEKRRRVSGIRERFGRQTNLGVCESGFQDNYQQSQWSFVAVGSAQKVVDRTLAAVEEQLEDYVDGFLVDCYRENL